MINILNLKLPEARIIWTPTLEMITDCGQPWSYPGIWAKSVPYKKVIEFGCGFTRIIAEQMLAMSSSGYKYRVFDVKDQMLAYGQNPCNGLWHADSSLNGEHAYENYIYVSGEHALTEFANGPITTGIAHNGRHLNEMILKQNVPTMTLLSGHIYKYDEKTLHRGVKAAATERRLLIRLTCSDRAPVTAPSFMLRK